MTQSSIGSEMRKKCLNEFGFFFFALFFSKNQYPDTNRAIIISI